MPRRADIQGLRAIAVVAVVAFHANIPITGGFVGVDVFFVISGFVIASMLERELEERDEIRVSRFFARRFMRLAPALAGTVLVTVALSALLQSPTGAQQITSATAVGALFLHANLAIQQMTGGYFQPAAASNPLLHTWSLSVEEQFYLIFPIILLAGWKLGRARTGKRQLIFALTALLTVVSLGLVMTVSRGISLPFGEFLTGFYSPALRAWEFGVGASLALALTAMQRADRRVPRWCQPVGAWLGAAVLLASLVVISKDTPFPSGWTLLPVAGTALLLYAGTGKTVVSRLLSTRPFTFIGDVSYSWYLWHWPLIVFTSLLFPGQPVPLLAAGALSLLPAIASFYWLEQPLRLIRLTPRTFWRAAAAMTVPVVALSVGLGSAAREGWWSEKVRDLQAVVSSTHEGWLDCMSLATMDNGPGENPTYGNCEWNVEAPGPPLYLVGDSNAAQFSEAVNDVGAEQERPFSMRTAGGCPFADVYRQTGPLFDRPDQLCRDYYESAMGWLEREPAGTVFVANTEGYWFEPSMKIGDSRETITPDLQIRREFLETGLASTVRALRAAGHEVILVQAVPHSGWAGVPWSPTDCSVVQIQQDRCVAEVPLAAIENVQAPAYETLEAVAATEGAEVLNLRSFFCADDMCVTSENGRLLYQDGLHISVATSHLLSSAFADAAR